MAEKLRRGDLLGELALRPVVGARSPLFEHHVALGEKILLAERQIGHAVGFHLHHQGKAVGGDVLEIAGVILAGKRVVAAAVAGDDLGKLADPNVVGALEHEMFEHVGDARFARWLIRRAGAIPH